MSVRLLAATAALVLLATASSRGAEYELHTSAGPSSYVLASSERKAPARLALAIAVRGCTIRARVGAAHGRVRFTLQGRARRARTVKVRRGSARWVVRHLHAGSYLVTARLYVGAHLAVAPARRSVRVLVCRARRSSRPALRALHGLFDESG